MSTTVPNMPVEWIDEIPTQPSAFKARVISVAIVMLAGIGLSIHYFGPAALTTLYERNPEAAALLKRDGFDSWLNACLQCFGVLGAACGFSGLLSFWRNKVTYNFGRVALAVIYPVMVAYFVTVWFALDSILDAKLNIDGEAQNSATIIKLWWEFSWPALATILYAAWLHVMMRSRSVYAAFTGSTGAAMPGDYILENVRTHGEDPRARRSFYASALTHLLVLVIIPLLLRMQGCVENYRVPKGSGNPVVAVATVKVQQKKKKKNKLSLRPNSAISFEIPDLDDTEVDKQMEDLSQVTYEAKPSATANAKAGKMGKGGGTEGGWPAGMDDYKIRFIRLEHDGVGWDDGMDESGADINFLRAFAQSTGFKKIASKGESHSIALLAKYAKDGFPPFVFLTGNGQMGRVSSRDIGILRDYCLNGGMLIADAGSSSFDQSFRRFIGEVFPDKRLLDIADDDMLYQLPNSFPDGAPAFWHHGGRRALGVKHDGRWIAFYHPGDMNDAWKSPGYSDVTPEMRSAAMNLGINLVYYAFNQWDDAVTKARK